MFGGSVPIVPTVPRIGFTPERNETKIIRIFTHITRNAAHTEWPLFVRTQESNSHCSIPITMEACNLNRIVVRRFFAFIRS